RRPVAAGVLRQWGTAQFLRLRAGGARWPRQQSRRHHRRARARPVPAGGKLPGRRHLLIRCRLHAVHCGSPDLAARPVRRGHGAESVMTAVTTAPPREATGALRAVLPHLAPFLAVLAAALLLPLVGNDYWAL